MELQGSAFYRLKKSEMNRFSNSKNAGNSAFLNNKPAKLNNDSLSFKGISTVDVLNGFKTLSDSPIASTFFISPVSCATKHVIYDTDKKMAKEDTNYLKATMWLGLFTGLGFNLSMMKPITKVSDAFAKSIFKLPEHFSPEKINGHKKTVLTGAVEYLLRQEGIPEDKVTTLAGHYVNNERKALKAAQKEIKRELPDINLNQLTKFFATCPDFTKKRDGHILKTVANISDGDAKKVKLPYTTIKKLEGFIEKNIKDVQIFKELFNAEGKFNLDGNVQKYSDFLSKRVLKRLLNPDNLPDALLDKLKDGRYKGLIDNYNLLKEKQLKDTKILIDSKMQRRIDVLKLNKAAELYLKNDLYTIKDINGKVTDAAKKLSENLNLDKLKQLIVKDPKNINWKELTHLRLSPIKDKVKLEGALKETEKALKNILTAKNINKPIEVFKQLLVSQGSSKSVVWAVTKAANIYFGVFLGLYWDRILDWGSKKITGKPFDPRPKKPLTDKEKADIKKQDAYWKKIGLGIATVMATAVALKTTNTNPVKVVKDLYSKNNTLKKYLGSPINTIKGGLSRVSESLNKNEFIKNKFRGAATMADSGWTMVDIVFNFMLAPLPIFTSKRFSQVARSVALESQGALLTFGGAKFVDKIKYGVANRLKVDPTNVDHMKGLSSLLTQLIVSTVAMSIVREYTSIPIIHAVKDKMHKIPALDLFLKTHDKETIDEEYDKQMKAKQAEKTNPVIWLKKNVPSFDKLTSKVNFINPKNIPTTEPKKPEKKLEKTV